MVEPPRGPQIQVAATGFIVLFSIVGIALYGLPLYYDFWVKEFGWNSADVAKGNAYSKLIIGPLFGFFAGWVIDRFGPRRLMMAGVLLAGCALIGLSLMNGVFWVFYLCYLMNALGYVCGGPLPNQVLLSRWFDKARGKAMGFAYLGIGIGGALVPLLSKELVKNIGWRGALCALGVLMIVLALPMAYFVKEAPKDFQAKPRGEPLPPIRYLFRIPAFYLLAFGSMCSIAAVGGTNQHLKLFLTLDQGYTQTQAFNLASLVLTFSIVGRLLMGWLADRVPKKFVMLLIYLLVASAIPLLFYAKNPTAMHAFAVIFGLGLGGEYLIIPLMASELFGVKSLGRLLGIVITADGVAEAGFPLLIGHLRVETGGYYMGFYVLMGLALLGAVAISLLPRKKVNETTATAPATIKAE